MRLKKEKLSVKRVNRTMIQNILPRISKKQTKLSRKQLLHIPQLSKKQAAIEAAVSKQMSPILQLQRTPPNQQLFQKTAVIEKAVPKTAKKNKWIQQPPPTQLPMQRTQTMVFKKQINHAEQITLKSAKKPQNAPLQYPKKHQ